ncbi:MAG TPA: DUF58 domain-containing protein [Vicinamibacterales bacterium]|nr:DUF58 domain-containing protein [Vicinamibacterales bacterium]
MRSREQTDDPFVNLSDLTEIELLILRRMREFTIGDHRSMFHGTGFDFVGLRDWQPGDRLAAIDWPQSSITNFSPLVVRDFDQPSTAGVMAVADTSPSTRCGVDGTPIAAAVARAIGTIGISAVFFQDTFGLITFDTGFRNLAAVRPRIGKNQVIHCLDAYQHSRGLEDVRPAETLSRRIAGYIRKPSLVPVISDFLFDDAVAIITELTMLNSVHDVVLVLIDSGFAFEVPPVSAGWVEAFDVETGRSRVMSRATLRALAGRAREWQDDVQQTAKHAGMDVLRLGLDEVENAVSLSEFVAERRLRKT